VRGGYDDSVCGDIRPVYTLGYLNTVWNDVVETCSTHWKNDKFVKNFNRKNVKEEPASVV
jgi:hypothetical protein